ncbi:iron complex transport system substrate-binding protein [Acetitomaculum ruminis DSM 5522]|uniref:Iron complex transport system substrate-binding protein n=1 Tax=Acetitomaculum ruminis DSM 5522 TaxID=1120918 RepID=A0A1I0ZK41_9FIRM|nr:ABC transporter substrate-binding protein [Acetitomaculum ruminis]SFB26129.1 iron complex transport system substrate-binding protein [Acetitomaculum ruminis DSM 5522]
MKKKLLALICVSAMIICSCGTNNDSSSTSTVTGSKGDQYTVSKEAKKVGTDQSESEYEPYTITLNLERSGIGQNMEETFTSAPKKAIADGDQMADFFFDLGLEDHMAGYTRGACWSTVSDYPARDKVKKITEDGVNLAKASKEDILATGCDFMMGWDSLFSENAFSVSFCLEHNIIPYFPYCCSDSATMEDIYKDYDVLGHIFGVEDLANEKVEAMKEKLEEVKTTLGDEVYENPIKVFVYDSGEDAPFTACQGVPGDMIKRAGGISIFDDIDKGWATPTWEEVVERDPDVILILDYDNDTDKKTEFLKTNDNTKNLRAVKEGKIYSACCSDMQGSAGSANTVEIMAKQFYPDKF